MRDKGKCPCPRCLVRLEDVDQLGTTEDMERRRVHRTYQVKKVQKARDYIYKKAKPITGANVEALLKDTSAVPTLVCLYLCCHLTYPDYFRMCLWTD